MALYKGDCKTCGRRNVELFNHNDKCLTCTRLDSLEKQLSKTIKLLNKLVNGLSKGE